MLAWVGAFACLGELLIADCKICARAGRAWGQDCCRRRLVLPHPAGPGCRCELLTAALKAFEACLGTLGVVATALASATRTPQAVKRGRVS